MHHLQTQTLYNHETKTRPCNIGWQLHTRRSPQRQHHNSTISRWCCFFHSNVFSIFSIPCYYISKVGSDFNYTASILTPPIISPTSKTTLFLALFFSNQPTIHEQPVSDRTLKWVIACDPIKPSELPMGERFDFGLAVGVGGELLPETLETLIEICDVFVDIQGLIREFDEIDGKVRLIKLKETKFYPLLSKIGVLKASAEEASLWMLKKLGNCVV